jgi:hypothetical protein
MRAALQFPNDGRLVEGLRLSPAGLRADAPWAFDRPNAAANWHASLTTEGVRRLAARVLENEGVTPAFVMLRRARGGKGTPAVVVRPGANPVAAAETIWRGMTANLA